MHQTFLVKEEQRQQPCDGRETESQFTRPDPGGMHVDETDISADGFFDRGKEGCQDDEGKGDEEGEWLFEKAGGEGHRVVS
ncbi:MAG: hypothetical protein CVU41_09885 [Chloroflexi bacterium HGW-Chloroflexi-3]|nr:MAG: hypothetical protein CVU41_09885 [Chloroflexi bacterium HGW-Chloroflexi-3]